MTAATDSIRSALPIEKDLERILPPYLFDHHLLARMFA
jgi:hypothetical protein